MMGYVAKRKKSPWGAGGKLLDQAKHANEAKREEKARRDNIDGILRDDEFDVEDDDDDADAAVLP